MLRTPTTNERFMMQCMVAEVVNNAKVGMMAAVHGIHDESTMLITIGNRVVQFTMTGYADSTDTTNATCSKCGEFAVPAPLDAVGKALMSAHIVTCKK